MKRVNTALTAKAESYFLDGIVKLVPSWITPDMLTFTAILCALFGGVLYYFSSQDLSLLWGVNFMLFVHWLSDSLDGRLARIRNERRDRYGYYVDHMLDSISAALFIGGITTSALTDTTAWVWVLALMLLSMIHAFLKAKVYGTFELSMQNFGPTEARMGLIFINCLVLFVGNPQYGIFGVPAKFMDVIGWIVVIGFIFVLISNIWRTTVLLDREDRVKRLD